VTENQRKSVRPAMSDKSSISGCGVKKGSEGSGSQMFTSARTAVKGLRGGMDV